MKKLILIILGMIPFVIGKFFNELMINTNMNDKNMTLFAIAFLVLWFIVGATSRKFSRTLKESVLLSHLGGIVSLLLMFVQVLITGGYFSNVLGLYSQIYFLPLIRLASEIERKLLFFTKTHDTLPIVVVVLALMISVYSLGFKVAENRK